MSGAGEPGWYFAPTAGGPIDGFNDSSREHFEGAHENYLAREIIQNSVDAKRQDLGGKVPVRVVFELNKARPADIAGLPEMSHLLAGAKAYAHDQEGAPEYYDSAIAAMRQDEITVLRVGDYNTNGLGGSDTDTGGNWARLVLIDGASSKKGAGGGSYGIGKNAAYVASAIRTVYYVSRNSDGELVFAGKAKISSFEEDGKLRRGAGQYGTVLDGDPYVSSIRGDENVPEYFRREEQGTDIYIAGYKPTDNNWRGKLIESVLTNFWAAIHCGNLAVEFKSDGEDDELIDANSLRTYLEEYRDSSDALPYYQALVESKPIIKDLRHLGRVELFVRVGEGLPRRIAMMRKPKMVVFKKLIQALHEDYAAVLVCENDKGNDLLRELEPPAHDKWAADRKDGRYKPAMFELEQFLRDALKSMNPEMSTLPEDVPGLSRYVWDIEERDDLQALNAMKGENTSSATDIESPREVGASEESGKLPQPAKTQVLTVVTAARGNDGSRLGTANRKNKTHTDGTDDGPGNKPRIGTESFDFRSFAQDKGGDIVYHVILKPFRDAKGAIKLLTVGEDGEFPAEVLSVTDSAGKSYEIEGSMVKNLELSKGQDLGLSIRLDSKRRYILGVESHEY